ncbi:MAG: hypothetical protein QG636_286 [Patescibacteria group bacterium]|nr:hypothetical protein [Patescibacteria group bacterium]
MSRNENGVAYTVTGIRLHSIDHLQRASAEADVDGLDKTINEWIARAKDSPSGFGVGSLVFFVKDKDGEEATIFLSTTEGELFLSVPA